MNIGMLGISTGMGEGDQVSMCVSETEGAEQGTYGGDKLLCAKGEYFGG